MASTERESLLQCLRRKFEGIVRVGRNRDAARVSGSRIALAPSSPGEARDWRTPQPVDGVGRECPICKGSCGSWQHFEVPEAPDSWDHTDGGACECGPRFNPCLGCNGMGAVSAIRRATLLARGDIAPVQRRGRA